MRSKGFLVVLATLAIVFSFLGCATAPEAPTGQYGQPTDLAAAYAALGQGGGKVFTLDPAQSSVRIYVFRSGQAARLGHNHVLSAPRFSGFAYLPDGRASEARFDLEFRLDQLAVEQSAAGLGDAFASSLSPEAIAGLREHMLGDDNLQADRFPFVRVHSLRIAGEAPKLAAQVQIEMHGQKRELWIPLDVRGLPDHLVVAGSFVLRQTDFGARPYAALGGLLAVQDEVVIEFRLRGA